MIGSPEESCSIKRVASGPRLCRTAASSDLICSTMDCSVRATEGLAVGLDVGAELGALRGGSLEPTTWMVDFGVIR